MLKISAFYLHKQKSIVPKKLCGMLVIVTLKSKISDFLNSNTCFCLRLYGTRGSKDIDGRSSGEDSQIREQMSGPEIS